MMLGEVAHPRIDGRPLSPLGLTYLPYLGWYGMVCTWANSLTITFTGKETYSTLASSRVGGYRRGTGLLQLNGSHPPNCTKVSHVEYVELLQGLQLYAHNDSGIALLSDCWLLDRRVLIRSCPKKIHGMGQCRARESRNWKLTEARPQAFPAWLQVTS
jgi:hypothetical protein